MSAARATGAVAVDVDSLRMPAPLTHAFAVPAGTKLVFLSGLTAKDADGGQSAPETRRRRPTTS